MLWMLDSRPVIFSICRIMNDIDDMTRVPALLDQWISEHDSPINPSQVGAMPDYARVFHSRTFHDIFIYIYIYWHYIDQRCKGTCLYNWTIGMTRLQRLPPKQSFWPLRGFAGWRAEVLCGRAVRSDSSTNHFGYPAAPKGTKGAEMLRQSWPHRTSGCFHDQGQMSYHELPSL